MSKKFKKIDISEFCSQNDYIDIKIGDWRLDDVLVSSSDYYTGFYQSSYWQFRFKSHRTYHLTDKLVDADSGFETIKSLPTVQFDPVTGMPYTGKPLTRIGRRYTTKQISSHDTIKIRRSKAARKRFKKEQKEWHAKLDDAVHGWHTYAEEDELSKMLQEKFCEIKLKKA